ncbi:hypothetical protein ACFL9U_06215 [Thermodesulfobacteriota bacterium]
MSVESNSIKALVEAANTDAGESFLLEILALFGLTLTFARVLSVLKSGYPAAYIGLPFSPRIAAALSGCLKKKVFGVNGKSSHIAKDAFRFRF